MQVFFKLLFTSKFIFPSYNYSNHWLVRSIWLVYLFKVVTGKTVVTGCSGVMRWEGHRPHISHTIPQISFVMQKGEPTLYLTHLSSLSWVVVSNLGHHHDPVPPGFACRYLRNYFHSRD